MKNIISEGWGILKFDTLSTNFTWKPRLHLLLEFSCFPPLDYVKSRLVMFILLDWQILSLPPNDKIRNHLVANPICPLLLRKIRTKETKTSLNIGFLASLINNARKLFNRTLYVLWNLWYSRNSLQTRRCSCLSTLPSSIHQSTIDKPRQLHTQRNSNIQVPFRFAFSYLSFSINPAVIQSKLNRRGESRAR